MKTILFFLFSISFLFGQAKIDSLMNSISNLPDTAKIRTLGDICFQNRYKDQEFAILCGEKAIAMSQAIGNKRLEAKMRNVAGVCYRILGNYEKSLYYFFLALNVFEESKDSVELGFAENNIGTNYLIKSYYTSALEHIRNGLEIFRQINDKSGMAYCTKAIGDIYSKQRNYTIALTYYDSTYILRKEIGYKKGIYTAVLKIAEVNASMKKYDFALQKYSEAEKGFTESNDQGAIVSTYEKIGLVYIEQKNYQKALYYTLKGYEISKANNIISSIITTGINLSIIYSQLGNFNDAEKYLNTSFKFAQKNKDNVVILECYKAFFKLYKTKGDLTNALKYSELASDFKDTVTIKESSAGAGEMETIYKNEKALKEKALLQKNVEMAKTQLYYLIIISVLLVLSFLVIYWRYQFKKRANIKLKELNSMKDKFFSIISHDLKNPFQGLIGLSTVLLEEIEKENFHNVKTHATLIHNSSVQGYQLLINLLEWSRAQSGKIQVKLQPVDLKEIIYDIIELVMPASIEKKISLGVSIEENMKCVGDANILNTVIRNLLTNAVKYTNLSGKIKIKAIKEHDKIFVSIADNGTGIKESDMHKLFRIDGGFTTPGTKNEKGTGLGLILCKDFISKLGGDIWAESEYGKGTTFTFSIPVRE